MSQKSYSGFSTKSDSIRAADPQEGKPSSFMGVLEIKPGDGALRAGVQAAAAECSKVTGAGTFTAWNQGPWGLLSCRQTRTTQCGRTPGKSRGRLRSDDRDPTSFKKEPVVRERERLNRDCKETRNYSHSSNAQADGQMKTLVKSVDLRDQVCFRGPRPGPGNLLR